MTIAVIEATRCHPRWGSLSTGRCAPVMYSFTAAPLACIFLTAATRRSTMRLLSPLAVQLLRNPWCTKGRVPRHQWPRFGGCVAYHAYRM